MAAFTWTIAVMCYNEAETLAQTVRRTQAVVVELCDNFEIFIIDDGSTDGSRDIALELEKEIAGVRALLHETNLGIGEVLRTGYVNASKNWFSVVPADLEFDPNEFRSGVPLAVGNTVVCYYLTNPPPLGRRLLTSAQRTLNFVLFGMWLRRVNWVKIVPLDQLDVNSLICRSSAIETEVMYRLLKTGVRPIWLPSRNAVRNDRVGGLNFDKLVRQITLSLMETFELWVSIRRNRRDAGKRRT